nr:response regulator [Stenotrophomonas sp. MMGLT7]
MVFSPPPTHTLPAAVAHLLVVDDHRSIREPLAAYLRRQGFEVTTASDGPSTRARLAETRFDLIVLDLMLPGEDGLSLCRYIDAELHTPVIMLTAKAEFSDRIVGLDLGADDYVTKPFSVDELVARIRSVLRRANMPPPAVLDEAGSLQFEGWTLDLTRHTLLDPQGQDVPLSTMEFRLLRVFLERPNQVLSRDDLLDLTSRDNSAFDRSIDSQVSRLRKKLEDDPRHPVLLKTIWGDGYLFAAEVRKVEA